MRHDPILARDEHAAAPSREQRGPWLRLLTEMLRLAGPGVEFLRHAEHAWTSATFTGSRHVVVLAFEGADALARGEAYIAALPEHEFTIARQIVADASVVAVEHALVPVPRMTVETELLLLEEG